MIRIHVDNNYDLLLKREQPIKACEKLYLFQWNDFTNAQNPNEIPHFTMHNANSIPFGLAFSLMVFDIRDRLL